MNSYQHRWRLAVALKQPYPSISDTGDVMPAEPTSTPSDTTITTDPGSWRASLEAFANTVRAARTIVIGTGILGLILGGVIGYNLRKKR